MATQSMQQVQVAAWRAQCESAADQTRDILSRIDALLLEAGIDKSKLISATIWLSDMSTFNEMNEGMGCGSPQGDTPARACRSKLQRHPRFTVEIQVIAALVGRPAGHAHCDSGAGLARDHQRLGVPSRRSRGNCLDAQAPTNSSAPTRDLSRPVMLSHGRRNVPRIMLRSLWRNDQAIRYRPSVNPRQWRWLAQFLGQCTTDNARTNTLRKTRLCQYSQSRLHTVAQETGFHYDRNTGGLIYFYRSSQSFEAAAVRVKSSQARESRLRFSRQSKVVTQDPGLADARDEIAGALFVPTDESGDARTLLMPSPHAAPNGAPRFICRLKSPAFQKPKIGSARSLPPGARSRGLLCFWHVVTVPYCRVS